MIPVSVHSHSEFSALDGYGSVDEIAARFTEIGCEAGFLTDHGVTCGWGAFDKAMRAQDLRPCFGVEAYQAAVHRTARPEGKNARDQAHLILLAQNDEGLRNINIMSDIASREGSYYVPRLDTELLAKYNEGVICTTACLGGLVAQGLKPLWGGAEGDPDYSPLSDLHEIFGDRLYAEVHCYSDPQQEAYNHVLVEQAMLRGIPLVYASDAHYCSASEYEMHEVLLCMQQHTSWDEDKGTYGSYLDPTRQHPPDLYIMDEVDIRSHLAYLPESTVDECIANSGLIADRCQAVLPESKLHLPRFQSLPDQPHAENNEILLCDLVEEGIVRLYGDENGDVADEVWERTATELEVLTTVHVGEGTLGDYMLHEWDSMQWLDAQNIWRGFGRGSSAGSIVAYALDITDVDPIKHGTMFERFYNAGREGGLPDIDNDIEKYRRSEYIDYLRWRFGEDRVMPIGNHVRMQPKAAIDKVGKALYGKQQPKSKMDAVKAEIEKLVDAGKQPDWEKIKGDREIWNTIQGYVAGNEMMETIIAVAEEMTGRLSNYAIHASAILVSDVDMPPILPARLAKVDKDSNKKILVTQVEMHEAEERGFVKLDALGLKTLDVFRLTLEQVGITDSRCLRGFDWDSLPEECWAQLETGRTLGLFQIEDGSAAKKIARDMKPRSVDDLGVVIALNRPGPLRSGVVDRYLARRSGKSPTQYKHPILESITRDTYGEMVYQEQIAAFFVALGYTPSDADHIRKIMGKKLVNELADEYPRYMEKALQFMDSATADEIWRDFEHYSLYVFNKSHSIAYGKLLAACMYLKWKYPAEFYVASISILARGASASKKESKMERIGSFVKEARANGIAVHSPDINRSEIDTAVVDGEIFYGLSPVKNVRATAARWITQNRPFATRDDLEAVLAIQDKNWKDAGKAEQRRAAKSPKSTCDTRSVQMLWDVGAFDELEPREGSSRAKAELQRELLGIEILDPDADYADDYGPIIDEYTPLAEVAGYTGGKHQTAGVIANVRPTKTRKDNKDMAIIDIRWAGQEARVAVFSRQYQEYRWALKINTIARFDIRASTTGLSMDGMVLLDADPSEVAATI